MHPGVDPGVDPGVRNLIIIMRTLTQPSLSSGSALKYREREREKTFIKAQEMMNKEVYNHMIWFLLDPQAG